MSLFKWSTPERRGVNSKSLPIIPNEIYFEIFGHIAPSTGFLTKEQAQIFTRLSRVCRLFANFCLPRIFEQVEFFGSVFRDRMPDTAHIGLVPYWSSRGNTLCAQLAAKQPLALALAQKVKVCHFIDWQYDQDGAWAVRLLAEKCIAGLVHMKHIRQLEFSNSYVDAGHWRAIATLKALEILSFDQCQFIGGPADEEPENRTQLKVSWLQVTRCDEHCQPLAAVDVRHLRTLVVDFLVLEHVDWLSQSALTEIRMCPGPFPCLVDSSYIRRVHDILTEAPESVEALWLFLRMKTTSPRSMLWSIFNDPERILPHLRSLTLTVTPHIPDLPGCLSLVLDDVGLVTGLESLRITLNSIYSSEQISPEEIRQILHESLGVASSLRYIDIEGKAFHLMDGVWSEVSCHTG